MRCPGQDRRYWTEDAVFEVPCPKCGASIELFKDESSGRCPNCACKVRNPKISFDCAQWCAYAEECLGFVPEREGRPDPGQGALASRLIRAIKEEPKAAQARVGRALALFQHARGLLATAGGDPRIVLAAALLLGFLLDKQGGPPRSDAEPTTRAEGLTEARRILQALRLDEDIIACVCRILQTFRTGGELDTMEFRVVRDACALAKLPAEHRDDSFGLPQES
jgi:hypothetical protein